MTGQYSEITETTIRVLVDAFYARLRRDPTLGPIFTNAIAEGAWPAHLEKMYAFWSSVMLTSGRYKGNPVATRGTQWLHTER
jgi:hemoglobin